jgi:protein-tyrosine phosphatase
MAEGALRTKAVAAGLDVEIDSAGLGAWHTGNPPHPPALKAALTRGYDNSGQRARQIDAGDFYSFDLIVGMDRDNMTGLRRLAPKDASARVELFHPEGADIPDPYYVGPEGFETALDMVEEAADALIVRLRAR